MASLLDSPIIKDGKVEIALEDETIINMSIAIFIALSLAIMVYFLLHNVTKK
jgi:hypothetical protein